ncbi:MAG: FeoB-associated Cys-rich membrane protein [Ruminococcaceae bacterium]|nr:FeoB-associated Cys-rich membrane protein [Oscillospiraceae bacterium]
MYGEIIAIAITVMIIGGACAYIIKAKKSGKRCIGCPDSASCGKGSSCSGNCSGCSCGCGEESKNK